ncbi:hypothetical protein EGN73_09490 [Arthrospiribacter ruber]|uniref:Uncharacterized protein n=2 Tax=Arthrospiribacter ruber TaxID=2487934 RepID=A0A951IXF6_9BACT|nr:hypothetical protein [Arthrospiribacter ruber]
MQEKWTFELKRTDLYNNVAQLLDDLFTQQGRDMGIFLSYYFKKEGAVVENVSLQDLDQHDKLSGKVTVIFDVIHFNACLNIHDKGKDKMELAYTIDPSNQSLVLTGPYWPEREMDEL